MTPASKPDPQWITCAKCGGPVQRVVTEHDPRSDTMRVTAYCHGEEETQSMTALEAARAISVELGGFAFLPPTDPAPDLEYRCGCGCRFPEHLGKYGCPSCGGTRTATLIRKE